MMKKTTRSIKRHLALPVCCGALALCLTAGAGAVSQADVQLRPDMTILIDGKEQTFYNAEGQEVQPILCDGTTYLPVRAIGEIMGKNVDWNQDTLTVTLSGRRTADATAGTPDKDAAVETVTAEVRDDFTIVLDGESRIFTDVNGKTVHPLLYNGSTYLPLRAIGGIMGKQVEWDGETKTVKLTGLVTDADTFSGEGQTPVKKPDGLLTAEDAAAKALEHAGLKAEDVTFIQKKLEWDDGRQVYDVEFYSGAKEYDYEIDAATGEIISFDHDAEHYTPGTGSPVTLDEAKELALSKVPGAAASHIVKAKQDRDDGKTIYEIEIVYSGMEYDFEIDAATGAILEFDAGPIDD